MANKKAIVTLTIGDKYIAMFDKFCRSGWENYGEKYGIDIITIEDVLDNSEKAKKRSPAWQKCLVLNHPKVSSYDQVAWVDTDILINFESPDIFQNVPEKKIGAVDEYSIIGREEYKKQLLNLYSVWDKNNVNYIRNETPGLFHEKFGLDGGQEGVVQTGVLVMSPNHHRDIMNNVYENYKDKGGAKWNYEMRPLSYEIQKNNLEYWLDPKFNMIWPIIKNYHYPFLNQSNLFKKLSRKFKLPFCSNLMRKCVTIAFKNNYFLHFAGSTNEMQYF